ncbi:MAG: rod shape-determining protein [Burkholderiales bacterium]
MLTWILDNSRPVIYVRLNADLIFIKNVNTGFTLSETPVIALSKGQLRKIIAVGNEAKSMGSHQSVDVVNPFKHPRMLISDFIIAEQLLKTLLRKAMSEKYFAPSPTVVFQPSINPEGGFTQVEIRSFHDLSFGAGARKSILWHGRELRDDELRELRFEGGGTILGQAP